jgi:flagellar motor protein MotB
VSPAVSHAVAPSVGDRTALVDTARHGPRRRPPIAWALLAIVLVGAALGGWVLWEQGRLARDEAADARHRLTGAHQRAATAENQVMAIRAERQRGPAAADPVALAALAEALRGALARGGGAVAIDEATGRVVVTLDDPAMWRAHDAELTPRGEALVDGVARALASAGDRAIWVHGHLDDAPLPFDAPYDGAWELSSARALVVVQRLAHGGIEPRRLAAVALGAERPLGTERARNRRIELVVDAEPVAQPAPASARRAPARP